MSYGVEPHEDCKQKFMELRHQQAYRFIIYKIEDKQIVVEKLGEPNQNFEDFRQSLPAEDCRYAVFDLDYVTAENLPSSKVFFVEWCPNTANLKSKIMYLRWKIKLRRVLIDISIELQVTEPSKMDLEYFKSHANYRRDN